MPEDPVVEAVRRLKRGEKAWADSRFLVDRLRPTLLAYFHNHRFRRADAEDLTQETLMKATSAIGSLRDEACFLGWLFQIARNVRLRADVSLRQAAHADLEIGAAANLPNRELNPLHAAIDSERLERVWSAIERLPPQQKQCLLLIVQDLSYEEIAALMRLNPHTVRNHLREARMNLRKDLNRMERAGLERDRG